MCASVWNISISHDGARTFFTCNENQNKKNILRFSRVRFELGLNRLGLKFVTNKKNYLFQDFRSEKVKSHDG